MVYTYIIRDLGEPLILGRPWINKNLIKIKPMDGTLFIRTSGILIKNIKTKPTIQLNIKEIRALLYGALVRRARRTLSSIEFNTQVFAVTLININKALKPKKKVILKSFFLGIFISSFPYSTLKKPKSYPSLGRVLIMFLKSKGMPMRRKKSFYGDPYIVY